MNCLSVVQYIKFLVDNFFSYNLYVAMKMHLMYTEKQFILNLKTGFFLSLLLIIMTSGKGSVLQC